MKKDKLPLEFREIPSNQILTIGQAAALLGVSVRTLQRWDASGKLTSHRTLTNKRFYLRDDIEDFKVNKVPKYI